MTPRITRRVADQLRLFEWGFVLGLVLAGSAPGFAADAATGKVLAERGNAAGVPACSACHGANGGGQSAAGIPRLAGVGGAYLDHQLVAFGNGMRDDAMMTPIAKAMDAVTMADVAAYYASLPAPQAPPRAKAEPRIALGEHIALRGDWSAMVPPCASCHGANGLGVGDAFPPLAGQSASYVHNQLDAWKRGIRRDDPLGLMKTIAGRLDDRQIAAVAAYYETLSAAPAAPRADAAPSRPPTRSPDASPPAAAKDGAKSPAATKTAFSPPPDSAIPDDEFGAMVKLGETIFRDPSAHAGSFVGNSLTCSNCHLDAGRLADSAPLAQAYVGYPAYREKNKHVNTFEERLQGCFRFSMNGKAPPLGDKVLVALVSYSYFLAKGAPTGETLSGRGYPKLPKPALGRDYARGATVFGARCALCHGADGAGQRSADGASVFPVLWGPNSFNWGAGMESIRNAAGFIKANMPLGQGGSLTDQEAWDVATYMDSHDRPQDPRFAKDVATTRMTFHDSADSMYGRTVDGKVLGADSPPSGPRATKAPAPLEAKRPAP